MATIPRDTAFDSTINIVREGYDFIWNRCRRFESDLFLTRVMGKPTVCIHGAEAAEVFYDESKFARHGALPRRVVTSLFGKNAVHTLDDAEHKERKSAFLGLMTEANLERLTEETALSWKRAIRRWQQQSGEIVLLEEVQCILADAVCTWAGLPLKQAKVRRLARDLAAMVDGFGGIGPRLWKAKLARTRTELWVAGIIGKVRRRKLQVHRDSALYVMANHRDANGRELDLRTAAVELLNVLRPTVAVAWYVAFAALALYEHPEAREKIVREPVGDAAGAYADAFMQEVRLYPFTPYLGARVRTPFTWKGHDFKPGTLVLLDVHGTDHDPRLWATPQEFRPERFINWSGGSYDFIPQGGGSHATGHRCPGEWITMHNVALALHFLTRCCTYEVAPEQDLSLDLTRMPTQPASGFIIRNVRATEVLERPAPRTPSRTAARDLGKRTVQPVPESLMHH